MVSDRDVELRGRRALLTTAFFDIVLFILVALVLYFLCGGTSMGIVYDADTALTLWHLWHALLIFLALLVSVFEMYVPLQFAVLALVGAALDVYVLVTRGVYIQSVPFATAFPCAIVLWVLDLLLLFTSLSYLCSAILSMPHEGCFGRRVDYEPLAPPEDDYDDADVVADVNDATAPSNLAKRRLAAIV